MSFAKKLLRADFLKKKIFHCDTPVFYCTRFTAVSLHFNIKNHHIGHLKLFIYATDLNTHFRKFTEKKLIRIVTLQGIRLINEDLSLPLFNIYKFRI